MIRRPPRSTLDRSSAASDVYKREGSEYARRAIIASPNLPAAYLPLVVNCALGGELEEAVEVLGLLKQRFLPHLTLKWIDDELPYVRADDRHRYLGGFRLAGLE